MRKRTMALALAVAACGALGMLALSARAAAPAGHFTDLGDGTVRDNLTGLVWQQGFSPSSQSQADSVLYCSTLTDLAGGGWRLPTVAELQTIVDESVSSPAVDTVYFPSTPSETFWSSSVVTDVPFNARPVVLTTGAAYNSPVSYGFRARCVR